MRINIFLPFVPRKPNGGLKVMMEYANKMVTYGHEVWFYFPLKISYVENKIPFILKYLYYKFINRDIPSWFNIDKRVNVKLINAIDNGSVEDADIILSTWWSVLYDLKFLPESKGILFNLIQDYETWTGHEKEVRASYSIAHPHNLVIADYLKECVSQVTGETPEKVQVAIDSEKFFIKKPITSRSPFIVIMLFSEEARKGTLIGMKALRILKSHIPELKVLLFGVGEHPAGLDDWMIYHRRPENLVDLYNEASIFLSPSNQEGCALPPMEAMHCGCAVVCTDIVGHKEYAVDGKTALLAKPGDASDLAEKTALLIRDQTLKNEIANGGNLFIQDFSWERSARKLEQLFEKACLEKRSV